MNKETITQTVSPLRSHLGHYSKTSGRKKPERLLSTSSICLFVCSGFTGSNKKKIIVLDSTFAKKVYRLFNILVSFTLKLTQVNPRGTSSRFI